jgi:hypothetical protein
VNTMIISQDIRSPKQWLAHFREKQDGGPRDPELRRIWEGASIYIFGHYRRGFFDGDNLFGRKLTAREEKLVGLFEDFLADQGNKLFREWMLHGRSASEDDKYFYILNGLCFSKYFKELRPKKVLGQPFGPLEEKCWDYCQRTMREGAALLRKTYLTQKLDRQEIDQLRLYAMWADITSSTWASTEGNSFLPFHLGLSRPFDSRFPKKEMSYGLSLTTFEDRPTVVLGLLEPGDIAPDFTLVNMEAVLESKDYSDINPFHTTVLLQPLVMSEILNALSGYRAAQDPSGRQVAIPISDRTSVKGEKNYVSLGNFRGRKPVLLMIADPTDSWAWNTHIAERVDCLHKIYGDLVEFLFINITVYDGYMPVYDYFGQDKGRMIADHPVTLEERARTAKMFYMGHPQVSIPILLDDMGQTTRNSYMDPGGEGSFCLVDAEGKVAYRELRLEGKNLQAPRAAFELPQLMDMRVNALEAEIRALLKNNGRRVATRGDVEIQGKPKSFILGVRIVDIDRQARTITLKRSAGRNEEPSPDPIEDFYVSTNYPVDTEDGFFTVRVSEQTRIARIRNAEYQVTSFDDLSIGDRVNVECGPTDETEGSDICIAKHIYDDSLRIYHINRYEKDSIWFCGVIREIDLEERIVTVIMPQDLTREMKGYFFWKEAEDRATLVDRTLETVPIVGKWVEGSEAQRTYRFVVDIAVDLFLNGQRSRLDELHVGDRAAVEYRTVQDSQAVIYPGTFRASRIPNITGLEE